MRRLPKHGGEVMTSAQLKAVLADIGAGDRVEEEAA